MTDDLRSVLKRIVEVDAAISKQRHARAEVERLRLASARECGNCDKWMKSRECPREHNVNGMSRGPSCQDPPCGQFISSRGHVDYLAQYEAARTSQRDL